MSTPRGIRNNNPGNIDWNKNNKWVGQLEHVASIEPRFCRFDTPEHGIRALAKLLYNYQRKSGIQNIAGIVIKYAPPAENKTKAYIDHVGKMCGVDPYATVDVKSILHKLVPAIIEHENGQQPYTEQQIDAGIQMALAGK